MIDRCYIATALLCLLLDAAAFAADGEILISQAKVNAGGITAGDTAGFPATLGRPGRYKLASNLTVPAGMNGIEITANDVTIDLNGFTIRSNSSPPLGIGVLGLSTSANRMRVTNGSITGFDFAISHNSAGMTGRSAVIENMRIIANGAGILVGSDARIRDSTVANNISGNILCSNCLIERSVVTGSANDVGIYVTGGTAIGNVIVGNARYGLTGVGTSFPPSGYGTNVLVGNNGGGAQVFDQVFQLHPNLCSPACP